MEWRFDDTVTFENKEACIIFPLMEQLFKNDLKWILNEDSLIVRPSNFITAN